MMHTFTYINRIKKESGERSDCYTLLKAQLKSPLIADLPLNITVRLEPVFELLLLILL